MRDHLPRKLKIIQSWLDCKRQVLAILFLIPLFMQTVYYTGWSSRIGQEVALNMKTWTTKSGQSIVRIFRGRCNCYLLSKANDFILIDAGRGNRWMTLSGRLDRYGVKKETLKAVVLTHCHFDHAENAARIREKYQTRLLAHRLEAEGLAKGENPPIHGTLALTKLLTALLMTPWMVRLLKYPPAHCDLAVEDVLDLHYLGFCAKIVHTPGHSPGSMSVLVDDEIAVVGDTLFGVWPGSVFPPFAADPGVMIKSWARLLDTGCRIFLPGHGSERPRDLLEQQYEKYGKKCGR